MAKLKIYNQIVDEETKVILQDWMGTDGVCYKDITEFLDSIDADDNQIDIKLHCPGGDCIEGWAIYDALRHSGKEISATIEGECSSMATVILLAAPKERRFGYENARMCIHNPFVSYLDLWPAGNLTADELGRLKGKLDAQQIALVDEQTKILNLYVERTGTDAETLQNLMNEDKYVDMAKAAELGFIYATVAPNTASTKNLNNKKMAKEKITIENRVLKKMLDMLGLAKVEDVKIEDKKFTAADGREFTVERETGDPQVGDKAEPDGTYVMDNGDTIVVSDGVIESVTHDDGSEDLKKEVESLRAEKQELSAKVEDLTKQQDECSVSLESSKAEVENLRNEIEAQKNEVEALRSENEQMKASAESMTAEVESLKAEKETLTAQLKTDEENAILNIVSESGGIEWLEALKDMQSSFNPSRNQFEEHKGSNDGNYAETVTQRMLREQREVQQAKRAAMKEKREGTKNV